VRMRITMSLMVLRHMVVSSRRLLASLLPSCCWLGATTPTDSAPDVV
jgi:hypothetical protein